LVALHKYNRYNSRMILNEKRHLSETKCVVIIHDVINNTSTLIMGAIEVKLPEF
jgi:adenine/guanine phosphoribosyltransferase-like PRPP-binding protein